MAKHKKSVLFLLLVLILFGGWLLWRHFHRQKGVGHELVKEVRPQTGTIQKTISSTATILPKNRLEIKPPVSGRIEQILVQEGDLVKQGEILAWMSSTERAALLDAARGQGQEQLAYWQDVYKAIPLIAPIDGEVIVSKTQPGQTIGTAEAIVVLSDHLIVRAQVDETDIGRISLGQSAVVTLDAYPDMVAIAFVGHIFYESKTINNVTMYEVDLASDDLPDFVRSGMNANVEFRQEGKENVLVLPLEAVNRQNGEPWVWIKQPTGAELIKRVVKLGLSDETSVEVVSGVSETDTVVVKSKKYTLPKSTSGVNPFVPGSTRR